MTKPVILAVDDPKILRADSGESALDTLGKLKLRGDPVALFLVDQRMPKMTGVEFLEEAIGQFPDAKRALPTAYPDTEATFRAINEVGLDYYVQKPWDPPDQNLNSCLGEQLPDWRADCRPSFGRLPLDVGTQNGG